MKEIVIIGAGDFGREVAWLIEDINKTSPKYRLLGYLDDKEGLSGKTVEGYPVLGNVGHLRKICGKGSVCSIIAMQDPDIKKRIVEKLNWFDSWENLIHPSALISEKAELGAGNIITARNTVSINVTIGNHCLLNIGCIIGHDCVIGDYVSIMSNSAIAGRVEIKEGSYLGTGVSIVPGKKVGHSAKIGIGSVVIRDVKDGTTVMGNPARSIKF